jgi:hypothetical protein
MVTRRRWVTVTIRTVLSLLAVAASAGRTHADEGGLTFFGWSDQHVAVNGDGQHLLPAIDAMNSLPGREFPAGIGGRVAEPAFVLGCGDITEWPTNAAKNTYDELLTRRLKFPNHKAKVDRFRDVNFVQLPSPGPNGSHEVTVIRITSDRLLAIPYQYESKTWSDVRGKILHVPIRGPASTAGVQG